MNLMKNSLGIFVYLWTFLDLFNFGVCYFGWDVQSEMNQNLMDLAYHIFLPIEFLQSFFAHGGCPKETNNEPTRR